MSPWPSPEIQQITQRMVDILLSDMFFFVLIVILSLDMFVLCSVHSVLWVDIIVIIIIIVIGNFMPEMMLDCI